MVSLWLCYDLLLQKLATPHDSSYTLCDLAFHSFGQDLAYPITFMISSTSRLGTYKRQKPIFPLSLSSNVVFVAVSAGFIAMYATLASRDVDCCLIPESPFYLEGPGGLYEYIARCLKDNGHMVIVIAEGAGQELLSECLNSDKQDASGNKLLKDVGLWISQKIKVWL